MGIPLSIEKSAHRGLLMGWLIVGLPCVIMVRKCARIGKNDEKVVCGSENIDVFPCCFFSAGRWKCSPKWCVDIPQSAWEDRCEEFLTLVHWDVDNTYFLTRMIMAPAHRLVPSSSCQRKAPKRPCYPLVMTHIAIYWKWPFIVDFPINNGVFPYLCHFTRG